MMRTSKVMETSNNNTNAKGSIMKKQMLKLMVIIGVAGFFAGTLNAAETIKLKTSKEISNSIFGTQTHFGQWWKYKEVMPLIEKAGLKWIRDEVYWGRVEKEKGVLKVPAKAQAWIDDANARGINVLIPLGYGNKHYPMKDFEAFRDGFCRYSAFLAKHFKGKVAVWQIFNEPTNFNTFRPAYGGSWNAKAGTETPWVRRYAELSIAAAKAIKAVDPDAIVIAGHCVFPINHHLIDILEEKGEAGLLDGLVIHPYTFKLPPEVSPYGGRVIEERDGISIADDDHTYSSIIRRLKKKMKSAGMKNTDLYATEFGYTTFHRTLSSPSKGDTVYEGFSEATQAKYLARYFMLHLANELKAALQYDFQDDGFPGSPRGIKHPEGNFGMVKHPKENYEPKPSYYAIQRLASLFCDSVKLFKKGFSVAVSPDRYLPSKNWKYIEPYMVWDGQEIQSLNRVEKYLFKNADTGEVMLVLWNAVRPSDRQDLLSDVTLETADYTGFTGVDIMTGKSFKVAASTKDGKTVLKNVVIPDYPVIIKMTPKK